MFTHDTVSSLIAASALVNTVPGASDSGDDEMQTTEDLQRFTDTHQYSGLTTSDETELAEVRSTRARLLPLWDLDRDGLVHAVNGLLAEHRAIPQLVRHDGHDWHIHAIDPQRPLAERIAVEAAMGMLDLLRIDEQGRLRRCIADDCDAVLVDLSRNRSRRFCDVGNCANRAHVASYRARKENR